MSMDKPNAVICDLDGTLFNNHHRKHFMFGGSWEEYHKAIVDDVPYVGMLSLLEMYRKMGNEIILLTARPEDDREATLKCLIKHDIQFEHLFCKPNEMNADSRFFKLDHYKKYIEPGYKVIAAFDDNPDVLDAWQNENIPTFQCYEGTIVRLNPKPSILV